MEQRYIYRQLNAFSSGKSTGNPCACIYLSESEEISEYDMLTIAKYHKGCVSEVIYCTTVNTCLYRLRYYSSECEVEFCGHATIACMYNLIKSNKDLESVPELMIETNKGKLKVYNEVQSHNAVYITAPEPEFIPFTININNIAENINIPNVLINDNYPIELIDAGLRTLIIPLTTFDSVINLLPDEAALKEFCEKNGVDIVLVFTDNVINKSNKIRTRVFAPKFGYLEDPATGSGNSAMGYYMLKHTLWNGQAISIEQNAEKENYNIVKLKVQNNKLLFGGGAVLKIEGYYTP